MRVADLRPRRAKMSPRVMTLTLLVWRHCEPLGWGQTYQSVADAIGCDRREVIGVARRMNWLTRFRSITPNMFDVPMLGTDDEIPSDVNASPGWV